MESLVGLDLEKSSRRSVSVMIDVISKCKPGVELVIMTSLYNGARFLNCEHMSAPKELFMFQISELPEFGI